MFPIGIDIVFPLLYSAQDILINFVWFSSFLQFPENIFMCEAHAVQTYAEAMASYSRFLKMI